MSRRVSVLLRAALTLLAGCVWLTGPGCDEGACDTGGGAHEPARPSVDDMRSPSRFAALIETIEAERAALGGPGAAVAVVEEGRVTFSRGFGSKRPDGGDPVLDTTLFRVGSVTKMLTTAGLLQQAAQGKVDLAQPLSTYVPDFKLSRDPTWAPSIAVRHLLTHSAGLSDFLQIDWPQRDDSALSDFLTGSTFADRVYLMAPAGRMWNYSNPNFMLAGLLLERVGGMPYRTYLRDRLLAPLGMARTMFLPAEVIADGDFAVGRSAGMAVPPDAYDNPWARPAGYAFSSVIDLARFAQLLIAGAAVLPDAARQAMVDPQINTALNLDLLAYGYALFVTEGVTMGGRFYRERVVYHGGDIPGFAADLYIVSRTGFAIVVLAGADGAHFQRSIAQALQQFAGLPAASSPPDGSFHAGDYDRYVGEYLDPFNIGPLQVAKSGDQLTVTMPLLDRAKIPYEPVLVPGVRHNFVLKVQGAALALTFVLDGDGHAEYARTRVAVARRVGAPVGAVARGMKLDRAALLQALHSPLAPAASAAVLP